MCENQLQKKNQQDTGEVQHPDYSGLASSLLPPNAAFFPAWNQLMPQPWQTNLAYAFPNQGSQTLFNGNFFQHPSIPSVLSPFREDNTQLLYRINENGMTGQAARSSSLSEQSPTQIVSPPLPMKDREIESGKVLSETPSSLQSHLGKPSAQTLPRSTLAAPTSLAELKIKARESIMAKRTQSIRSSTNDSPFNERDKSTQPSMVNRKTESNLKQNLSEIPIAGPTSQLDRDIRTKEKSQVIETTAPASEVPTILPRQDVVSNHSTQRPPETSNASSHQVTDNLSRGPWKATSVELDDLLAEGKAAAHGANGDSSTGPTCRLDSKQRVESLKTKEKLRECYPSEKGNSLMIMNTERQQDVRRGSATSLELGEIREGENGVESILATSNVGVVPGPRDSSAKSQPMNPGHQLLRPASTGPYENNGAVPRSLRHFDKPNIPSPPSRNETPRSSISAESATVGEDLIPSVNDKSTDNGRRLQDPASQRQSLSPAVVQVHTNGHMRDVGTGQRSTPQDADTSEMYYPKTALDTDINASDSDAKEQSTWTLGEVEEWLHLTGFFDESHRTKVLNRHRRLKLIEEERTKLLLEEEEDQAQRIQLARSLSSCISSAPPLLAIQRSFVPKAAGRDLVDQVTNSAGQINKALKSIENSDTSARATSLKRSNSVMMRESPNPQQPEKKLRTGASAKQTNSAADGKRSPLTTLAEHRQESDLPVSRRRLTTSPPLQKREVHPSAKEPSNDSSNPPGDPSLAANSVNTKHNGRNPEQSATYDDRRGSNFESRNSSRFRQSHLDHRYAHPDYDRERSRKSLHSPERQGGYDREYTRYGRDTSEASHQKKGTIDLRAGGTRYFIVKSWNYENIELAHRECTWVTQEKNEEVLTEAFKTCRHVILLFSTNMSKAFQGYARMQSLPGGLGVKEPSWKKNLHWPTSEAFRLKWITTEETYFRVIGKLKNPLNEGLPVFVGRDGQEIEEEAGAELCERIDEDARWNSSFHRN